MLVGRRTVRRAVRPSRARRPHGRASARDDLPRQRAGARQEAVPPRHVHRRQRHRDPEPGPDRQALARGERTGRDRGEVAGRDHEAERGEDRAHDHARGDGAHGGRRGQIAEVDGTLVVAGHHMAPPAVVLVLLGERADTGPRAVLDAQLRREPDQAAGLADAEVQLPVLGADELHVVAALPLQRLAPEGTQVHGLRGSRLAARVEGGVADADPRGHRGGDRFLPGVLALGVHDTTDVLRARLLQEPDGGGDVVRGEHAVAVHAHHDRVTRGLDRRVESGGRTARGVRHGRDAGILADQLGGDLVGAVRGRAERDHHLHLAVVLLLQDVTDRGAQIPLLVEDRHDHGDGVHGSSGSGVTPRKTAVLLATLPRTGDSGARRPGGAPLR